MVFSATMPCPACGKAINKSASFCKYCDWRPESEIAKLATQGPMFDLREQYEMIRSIALPGEEVQAVFDMKGGGTGFIGITTKRVIVYDKVFMRKMKAIVTIPYSRIYTIAAQDESGLFTGRGIMASSTLILTTSKSEYEFVFRGADKAHIAHGLIAQHMVS